MRNAAQDGGLKMSATARCGWGASYLTVAGLCLAGTAAQAEPQTTTRLMNEYVECVLGRDGCSRHVFDRRTGADYALADSRTPVARVKRKGQEHVASELSYANGILSVKFGDSGISAVMEVTVKPRYFIFEVKQLTGDGVEEFTFVDIPLSTRGLPDEPFAACALALNLQTNVRELPQAASRLAGRVLSAVRLCRRQGRDPRLPNGRAALAHEGGRRRGPGAAAVADRRPVGPGCARELRLLPDDQRTDRRAGRRLDRPGAKPGHEPDRLPRRPLFPLRRLRAQPEDVSPRAGELSRP